MKSPIPEKVARVRKDITSYLFHFVNRDGSPADTLRAILADKFIRGGVYSPSASKTICLTEAPLADVVRADGILDSHSYQRLSLWGIGFKKAFIFKAGGLPVIYQPRARLAELQATAHWRHVEFDLAKGTDFTWQREWRVPADELHFESEDVVLVVPSVDEFVEALWHVSIDIEDEHGELTYYSGVFKNWDFIPLEHSEISDDSSIEVCRGDDFVDIIQDDWYGRMEFHGP
jgi:hypothetical protein